MKHQELVNTMTLEEKAAFLTGKNEWSTRGFESLGIPAITFADGPSGVRRQTGDGDHLGLNPSEPATCFPSSGTLANSWDEELEEEVGRALGREAAMSGVSVLLAPGLNIKRNPLCGRNFEYFSEDPYLSGKLAAAMIRGIESQGVGACPKHFAVNNQEERRMALNAVVDERTLRELYLTGFEIAVKEGRPKALMSAYNQVNGVYANEHYHLLTEILREDWGFDGFVVTDWGGGNDYTQGIQNGSNLQMPGCGLECAEELVTAVKEGSVSERELDRRVDELLQGVLTLGKENASEVNKQELFRKNHDLARRAAQESIVLLKNEGQILPLKEGMRAAVIGDFAFEPRYQGAGSSAVHAVRVESAAKLLEDFPVKVSGCARGWRRDGEKDLLLEQEALALAKDADVVLFFLGLCEQSESEGLDRRSLSIPENQLELLRKLAAANSHIVGILSAGGVVDTSWESFCRAILHTGLSGQAGASALFNVLTGRVNPSGKLSETFPIHYEDVPSAAGFPEKGRDARYQERFLAGYRHFDRAKILPAYPFGFGLSYTCFSYGEIKVSEKGVSVRIKNTGKRDGSEVVQCYISLPKSKILRPEKELKGFAKVFLRAGEEKKIFIPFDEITFRYWDTQSGRWETEPGNYQILIGASSEDIRLCAVLSKSEFENTSAENTVPQKNARQNTDVSKSVPRAGEDRAEEREVCRENRREIHRNDPLSQMAYARSRLARGIAAWMKRRLEKAGEQGKAPDLNTLFQYNMPFRAIAKMTAGRVSMEMVDGMLLAVNGQLIRGFWAVVSGYFRNRRRNRQYEALLKRQAEERRMRENGD